MYILPIQPAYFAQPVHAFVGFIPPEHCFMADLATLATKTDLGMSEC